MVVLQKAVVITGVSSGIGYESAKLLTGRGFKVFGSVRRDEDADRCRKELGPNFVPLLFDVRDAVAIQKAAEEVGSVRNKLHIPETNQADVCLVVLNPLRGKKLLGGRGASCCCAEGLIDSLPGYFLFKYSSRDTSSGLVGPRAATRQDAVWLGEQRR